MTRFCRKHFKVYFFRRDILTAVAHIDQKKDQNQLGAVCFKV